MRHDGTRVEEVELRASGFEKEELLGLTDGGKPGPENAYFSVAADLFIPELVCYWNIVDIRDVGTASKIGI